MEGLEIPKAGIRLLGSGAKAKFWVLLLTMPSLPLVGSTTWAEPQESHVPGRLLRNVVSQGSLQAASQPKPQLSL